jgi:hypothetical protein
MRVLRVSLGVWGEVQGCGAVRQEVSPNGKAFAIRLVEKLFFLTTAAKTVGDRGLAAIIRALPKRH